MSMRRFSVVSLVVFGCGFAAGQVFDLTPTANAQGRKVYELRTYTAPEGKLPNLLTRFRDHTTKFFDKYDMENVGYFVPQDSPASGNTLIYILAHDSREAATKSWDAFRQDPGWIKVRDESQVDGVIVSNVQSVFMEPTDFSPMK
jgi:NIPSNAP protein